MKKHYVGHFHRFINGISKVEEITHEIDFDNALSLKKSRLNSWCFKWEVTLVSQGNDLKCYVKTDDEISNLQEIAFLINSKLEKQEKINNIKE